MATVGKHSAKEVLAAAEGASAEDLRQAEQRLKGMGIVVLPGEAGQQQCQLYCGARQILSRKGGRLSKIMFKSAAERPLR